jgi:predicted metalloprotease with PDZ domain
MAKKTILLAVVLLLAGTARAQLGYSLTFTESSPDKVTVSIRLPREHSGRLTFIMPRSVPGAYSMLVYDLFVERPTVVSVTGERTALVRDRSGAPRWSVGDTAKGIIRLEYDVDLKKMESRLGAGDASIRRPGFAGILNYSIFGWIDGTENERVECTVTAPSSWPIFSSESPTVSPSRGELRFAAENYYKLADGQIFMGPRFRVKHYDAPVPLFVVSYSETEDEYLDDYGKQGVMSMNILKEYFGELPFRQYSILLRKAVPLEPSSAPSLAMEHLQSSTFFGGMAELRRAAMSQLDLIQTMPTYLHHMAHSYIPLRSYGDAYRPYVQEIPPIINNIWFNEGFMWYLPYVALKADSWKTRWINNTANADPAIKRMTLEVLSQEASTMYGSDFRLGAGIYSRGAMMALEMDAYLKEKSGGTRSMKDVLRYIYNWSKVNKRPFTMAEFPEIIDNATGIRISQIYEKWRAPLK